MEKPITGQPNLGPRPDGPPCTFLVNHALLPEVDYCELDQLLHVHRRRQEARELPEHGGQLAHELVQAGLHEGGDRAQGAEVGRRDSGEDPG